MRDRESEGRNIHRRKVARTVGLILRVATLLGVIASVLAFLIFLFSDNLVGRRMERAAINELAEEGLSRASMRPTPVKGFTLEAEFAIEGELIDAALGPEEGDLWITDSGGRILRFDLELEQVSQILVLNEVESPHGIALAQDGRLLVTAPEQALVVYVDNEGRTEVAYSAALEPGERLVPLRVQESGSYLYILSPGEERQGIHLVSGNRRTGIYPFGQLTDMVAVGGYLYVTGEHGSGLPVAKLSSSGANTFAHPDLSWTWALQYWDQPFVGLTVDEKGLITIVDANGYVVQLSPTARVLLQAPPDGTDLGPARAVNVHMDKLWVLHQRGLKRYGVNGQGERVQRAVNLQLDKAHHEAIAVWEELVAEEPDLLMLRRWLGEAYLLDGQPRAAAKHLYLAGDEEALQAAAGAEAYRIRKESLWRAWWTIMATTVGLWIVSRAWTAFSGVGE